jgi:anti-sigma regulatory factor (Ser/Thr protein kinase)
LVIRPSSLKTVRELALHILDILQNTSEAGATQVALTIDEDQAADRLTITVHDNGRGMDEVTVARAINPFFTSRTTRHVGLGLPLLAAATERAGGQLTIQSEPGVGTTVTATFQLRHPDRQPLGDMAATLLACLLGEKNLDLQYVHRTSRDSFEFNTADIRAALGDDVELGDPVVRQWLSEFLLEGEQSVQT